MNEKILEMYKFIQDISWYFGNQTFGNECCEDLSLVEYMVLKNVYEFENMTVQQIGVKLNITKSGVSKIIDRLEDKKYVSKIKSLEDGRVCCIKITDNGVQAIEKIFTEYTNYLTDAVKHLNEDTISKLKENLENLYLAIEKKGYIK